MIVGTAGHIDHGKTSLVKALTGIDADRLPEEKARGITLDLGYAYAPPDARGERLGFIDVPGHERLVHNMLAGATGIDFLLLVVAADDGPMPQTREHLTIASLLGIPRGAVALSKCDAVPAERLSAARAEVAALLAATPFAGMPCFAVSARDGSGIPELAAHLHAAAAGCPANPATQGRFRLAIDRCFAIAGAGTVVTGTVFSGRVRVGDTLRIGPAANPDGIAVRVRGLRVHDAPAEQGEAGQRVAVNLAGDFARSDIRRGQWLTEAQAHQPRLRFGARLRLAPEAPGPLRHWAPVHLHLGAEDVTARVALLTGDCLEPAGTAWAELICDRPVGCAIGDRFILRDASATHTVGGGVVLEPDPPARGKRSPARLAALAVAAAGDPAAALAHALAGQPAGVSVDRWAAAWNLAPDAVARHLDTLAPVRIAGRDGLLAFAADTWPLLAGRLCDALAAEHERAPDLPGAEHERLRRLTLPQLPRAAFDRLVDEALATGRIARTGSWLHLPGHRVTLDAADRDLWRTLAPLLAAQPFNPPRVRDVAQASGLPEGSVRALFKRVARTGALYPVAHDHFFTARAVAALAREVAGLHARDGAARAAGLRDRIGGGRKVAIHILEFFDRIGYTRRVRDLRGARDEHRVRDPATAEDWATATEAGDAVRD